MSLPATIYGDYIPVVAHASTQGLVTSTAGLQFGVVNVGNENLATGASILFKYSANTIQIKSGSTNYFLISESDIVLIEDAALS